MDFQHKTRPFGTAGITKTDITDWKTFRQTVFYWKVRGN